MIDNKINLYLALILSIITYSFWSWFPKGSFYIGNALFLVFIARYIFNKDKKSLIIFLLYELTIANLIKELLITLNFDFVKPGELSLGEALLIVIIPFIWYLKNIKTHDKYNRVLERD